MIFLKWVISLLACFPLFLNAQDGQLPNSELSENTLELLLEEAIFKASRGMWNEVLALLDDAERQFPGNEKIDIYRQSVEELRNLEREYESGEIEQEYPDNGEDSTEEENKIDEETESQEPFVINHSLEDKKKDNEGLRDSFRFLAGLKLLSIDSQNSREINIFNSANGFLYSYLNVHAQFWFTFLGDSVGFMVESSGFEIRNFPALYNKINLGINIRGFLFETEEARMEVGSDIGVAMNNHLLRGHEERYYTPFLKVWVRDSLLYRLFKNDVLQNLIIESYFMLYPVVDGLDIDLLNYGFDLSWKISNYFLGTAFDWWYDTLDNGENRISFGFSVFMGYRY